METEWYQNVMSIVKHQVRETRAPDRSQKKYIREIARVCRQMYQTTAAALADNDEHR